jgi:four helix bundle protein
MRPDADDDRFDNPDIASFRDLVAWQKGMELTTDVYQLAGGLPADERFGLTSQLRRASVSVPANIAEGYGRGSLQDYVRFLRIARGSLYEVDTLLTLSLRLRFIGQPAYDSTKRLLDETERILAGLLRALERRLPPPG